MLYTAFLFMIAVKLASVEANGESPLPLNDVSDDELKAAIKSLHGQLDDNRDGKLDLSESQDFVSFELGHPEGKEKSDQLHRNDLSITFEELWESWKKSEVYRWTNQDILGWLENQVELPCYSTRFQQLNITGRHLPNIAVNTQQFIQLVLKVTNIQHRTKLSVRAMDIVLFGPQNSNPSRWKDGIVVVLLTLCIILVFLAVFQRRFARKRIDSFLEESRVYEKELNELKKKLEQWQEADENEEEFEEKTLEVKEEFDQEEDDIMEDAIDGSPTVTPADVPQSEGLSAVSSSVSPSRIIEEELGPLKEKVRLLETQLETQRVDRDTLRPMLVQCYRREHKYLVSKKRRAEEDVLQAQLMCEKIKRKRSTLIDAFRLANSSALEDTSVQMNKAINKMQKMTDRLDEYHERWSRIERLCGFSVCHASAVMAEDASTPSGNQPVRKTSRGSPPSAPNSEPHLATTEKQDSSNTRGLLASRGSVKSPSGDGFGSQASLTREKEVGYAQSTLERQSMKLGRVSSITSTDSNGRDDASSSSTLTRRKAF